MNAPGQTSKPGRHGSPGLPFKKAVKSLLCQVQVAKSMVGQSGRLVQEKLLQHFESVSQHAFTMMWETLVASDRNVCMLMGTF